MCLSVLIRSSEQGLPSYSAIHSINHTGAQHETVQTLSITALAWGVPARCHCKPQSRGTAQNHPHRRGHRRRGQQPDPPRRYSTALAYTDGVLEEEFKKDGVKMEWQFFKGAGPAVNEALVNKQLDFAWQGDLPSIVHRSSGVKTRIILGSGVRTGLYLAVQPDSDIRRLEDLKGKQVALFKGTNLHLAAVARWPTRASRSATSSSSTWTWPAANTALANKDIDATFGYVGLFDLRDKGLAKVIWSAGADNYKYTRQTALLVTDDFAAKHPQAVQRVVTAMVKTAHQLFR